MELKEFIKNKGIRKDFKKTKDDLKCGVCEEVSECYTDCIGSNFTNIDMLKSPYICKECANLWADDYRKKSFYIAKKARVIQQGEILDILNNIEFPCILSFTESNKKHRLFRSKISLNRNNLYVITDDHIIKFDLDRDLPLLEYLGKVYNSSKISKSCLLSGRFPLSAIRNIGIEKYLEYRHKTRFIRNSYKFKLLIDFINKYD
ncbi:MAG: hypothetical protein ACOCWW_01235 [Bacteroidota bacterium]